MESIKDFVINNRFWLVTIIISLVPIFVNIVFFASFEIDGTKLIISSFEILLVYNIIISSLNVFDTAASEQKNMREALAVPVLLLIASIFLYIVFYAVDVFQLNHILRNITLSGIVFALIVISLTVVNLKINKIYRCIPETSKVISRNYKGKEIEFKNIIPKKDIEYKKIRT